MAAPADDGGVVFLFQKSGFKPLYLHQFIDQPLGIYAAQILRFNMGESFEFSVKIAQFFYDVLC
ncbi:hypothetical protein VQ056_27155 [Paenibacillus sp. JTLBN-2024]